MSISAKDVMALRQKTGAGMMDCKKALAETNSDIQAAIKWLREKGISSAAKRAGRTANEGRIAVAINGDATKAAIVELNSETDFVAMNEEFIQLTNDLVAKALEKAVSADDNGLIPTNSFDLDPATQLAGKIGENIGLARAGALSGTFVDSYIHPGDLLGVLLLLVGDGAKTDAGKVLAHDLTMQIAAASPQFVTRDQVPKEVAEKEKEIYKTQMRNEGKPEEMLEKISTGKLNKFYEEICLVDQVYVKEQKQKVRDRIAEAVKAAGAPIEVKAFLRFKVGETASESEDKGE
ncbi:MAG: translation elongation factor Ts [bacterium]